jgi:hypothetical protein
LEFRKYRVEELSGKVVIPKIEKKENKTEKDLRTLSIPISQYCTHTT